MRPIKITMTAFGPYKDKQVVDFREIQNHQLFVISGKTGAGKTTIFDAICYALYGEANGEDRSEVKLLRSDFADDDTYTSVELEFELKGRKYRVDREMPHVKLGRKSASGGKVELYEITTGTVIPCLDKFYKTEVNQKLIELVGLTKAQFSQIVMLPQGEFRKLLTSETDNKEQILRRIFKTDSFKNISDLLDQRRKHALTETQKKRAELDVHIGSIPTSLPKRDHSCLFETLELDYFNPQQVIQGLSDEIQYYIEMEKGIKKELDKCHLLYQQKESEYHLAKGINDRFAVLGDYRGQLEGEENKATLYREKEQQLTQAERASFIQPYEEQVTAALRSQMEKEKALADKNNILQQSQATLESAQHTYQAESQKEQQRNEVQQRIQKYEEWIPIVTEMDLLKKKIYKLEQDEKKYSNQLQMLENLITDWKKELEQLKTITLQMEKEVSQLPVQQKVELDLSSQEKWFKQFLKLDQDYHTHITTVEIERRKAEQLRSSYNQLEEQWITGQASLLAKDLVDGNPCPVCGSHEHPRLAEHSGDIPSKEQLEQKKQEKDTQNQKYQKAEAELDAIRSSIEALKKELQPTGLSLNEPQSSYEQLINQLTIIRQHILALEKTNRNMLQNRTRIIEIEGNIAEKEKEKENIKTLYHQIMLQKTKEITSVDSVIKTIPQEAREIHQLQQMLAQATQTKKKLEENWKKAQDDLQSATLAQTKAQAEQQSAANQLLEASSNVEASKRRYEAELTKAGFTTENDYLMAKLAPDVREEVRKDIERYKTGLLTLRKQILDLEQELQGKIRTNLDLIAGEVQRLNEQYKQLLQQSNHLARYREDAVKLKEFITKAHIEHEEKAKKLGWITSIHDMVKGDNELKLSFERYLQIEYLESIIKAANQRLRKMTNGQFQLDRRRDREARGKQSGLGLDVLDAYTGQYRDVKSLSGGEKFKASLCLALGLSDVIQSHDGGISIETMFIDEGFGSLDEESLNEAIDILVELQKAGRMIGVISHVQELKDAIPAVLDVQKTKEGYSKAQFVIR